MRQEERKKSVNRGGVGSRVGKVSTLLSSETNKTLVSLIPLKNIAFIGLF